MRNEDDMYIGPAFDNEEFNKCMRGEMYLTTFTGRDEAIERALELCQEFNQLKPSDHAGREKLLRKIFGKLGKNPDVEPNLFCGFGFNITAGDNFYVNNNCVFVDPGKITFGDNVFIGPLCGFYTAHHPINYKLRNQLYEYAFPINVGNNVWFGGGCQILPGISIGNNTVIGAGSVVTKDVPDNCVAAGNPCKVLYRINECEENQTFEKEIDSMDYGKKIWIFADGDMPPQGEKEPFGHEALTITNCTDEDAIVSLKILYTDREPESCTLHVSARRVCCFRLDYPIGDENYQIPKGQYSLILTSNVPIISVFGRLDRRKDFAYYEMDGFCM